MKNFKNTVFMLLLSLILCSIAFSKDYKITVLYPDGGVCIGNIVNIEDENLILDNNGKKLTIPLGSISLIYFMDNGGFVQPGQLLEVKKYELDNKMYTFGLKTGNPFYTVRIGPK